MINLLAATLYENIILFTILLQCICHSDSIIAAISDDSLFVVREF